MQGLRRGLRIPGPRLAWQVDHTGWTSTTQQSNYSAAHTQVSISSSSFVHIQWGVGLKWVSLLDMFSVKTIIKAWLSLFSHKCEICNQNFLTFGSHGIFRVWMAFVVFDAKPLGFLEESHRSQPPPLDGSIAEGMAVLCLPEVLAGSNAPCDWWEQSYLGKALPGSQSHMELYPGTMEGTVSLREHCSFVRFLIRVEVSSMVWTVPQRKLCTAKG